MGPKPVISTTFTPKKADRRCRGWAKIIRADGSVPLPANVGGANDIPGEYLPFGQEIEAFPGDWILEGEENHHVKRRGWSYWLRAVLPDGSIATQNGHEHVKPALRELGRRDLLGGVGDCAALIRSIHLARIH